MGDVIFRLQFKPLEDLDGIVAGIISALTDYKKSPQNWRALREKMMEGLDLLVLFEKAKEFIVDRDAYDRRGDAWKEARALYFIERLPFNSPGWTEWNAAIEHQLLIELCRITEKNRPYAKILKGIVYEPRDEFSPTKIDQLCGHFNWLVKFFKERPDWQK